MEFVGGRSSSAGAAGLLVVPSPNYLDFDVDLDDDDEEVVIRIRPKSSPEPRRKTSVSEEESDISEPPSLSGSRRVSFADAVGLNLVQVKEFDKWDIPQIPGVLDDTNQDEDAYYIAPFNFLPSQPSDEILAKVLDQKVELESIELLPGTTILKGVILVLNISFTKSVFVRTSLDNWVSHFDLLSEYVPGSSDGHLDRFAFKLTLVPPFAEQGARVDFCLRYETPNGTFWDNNDNKNYVLFCHKRRQEAQNKLQKESVSKKSCLKSVSRSFSVEESMSSPERENLAADVTTRQKIINETNQSDNSPVRSEGDANELQAENRRNRSRRNRRKAARMARVRDHFAQKDLTTQDNEAQASSEKHIPTVQEQNQTTKQSNPKGSAQLEDTADGSMSKDSNSKTHENVNLADAATLANDCRDESKDVPNVAPALFQNTNIFVSTSEEAGLEAAGYCGHLSGQRDDSEKLVSDSSGFAFGTVVAPLYHEVSGRGMGSQPCSEIHNSRSRKEQREAEERSSDAGRCCNEGKVESSEQSVSSNDETLKIDNACESSKSSKIQDSTEVLRNTLSDPVCPIDDLNFDLENASEKVLDQEIKIQHSNLSLDHQETFANESFQIQLLENSCIEMKSDETLLTSEEQDRHFEFDNQPSQPSNIVDLENPSLGNSDKNSALPPSNVFQEENTYLFFELSQNELANDITIETGLEFVDKTSGVPSKEFRYGENVLLPCQPSQNEDLVDQSSRMNDVTVLPSLDIEPCNVILSSLVSKTATESPNLNSQLSQNVHANVFMDENSLEFEDQTRAVSPKHFSQTPEDADKSLGLEQFLLENLSSQPTNTSNHINEPSPDSSASILNVLPISEEENAHLASQLSQNVDWSLIESIVLGDQSLALSPACTFETPEKENHFLLIEQNKSLADQPNNKAGEVCLDHEGTQRQESEENIGENECLLTERKSCLQSHSTNNSYFIKYDCDDGSVTSNLVKSLKENPDWSLQSSQNDELNTSNAMEEHSLEFEDQTRAVSPNHVSETPEDADNSLLLEQMLAEDLSSQPTNTSNLINEQSPDSSASILIVSAISEEENAQMDSQLSQNDDWPDHYNENIVSEDQSVGLSPAFDAPKKENQFLLIEQSKGLVDQPSNTSGEGSIDDEVTQTPLSNYATHLSIDENTMTSYKCGILDEENVTLLQNEDFENKSSTATNHRLESGENLEENACLLLERNSCVQDPSTNHSNSIDSKHDSEAGSVAVTLSLVSESLAKNPNLSLRPCQEDPDELNIENDDKMLAISSDLVISGGENKSPFMQFTQNEVLSDNTGDLIINLVLDPKLSDCQDSNEEENASYGSVSLVDQPSNANSHLAQSGPAQDFTKTVPVFEKEDEKMCNPNIDIASCEIRANSGTCFGNLEVIKGCVEIEQKETSKCNGDEFSASVQNGIAEDLVESKTNIYCDQPDGISISRNVEDFEIASQIEMMDITFEDGVKTWEVMVDEEEENLGLQDTNEGVVDVMINLMEVDELKSLEAKIDDVELSEMSGSQRIENALDDIEKKGDKLEDQVNNETYFAPVFDDAIPTLCTRYVEIVKDCESVNENERIESKIMDSVDNMPGCEGVDVDDTEKVKVQSKANEEERFKVPPRKVKRKLSALTDNVQKGIQSSQDKIVEETTYVPIEIAKTDFLCCSNNANDNTLAGDLNCDQNSDNDDRSESESGSEDEMELYMHCLRAVYGQQSSPKAIKPAQNRDEVLKRLPSTRSKRLSTSLPSISESLDEDQPIDIINMEEKEIETLQGISQALPDPGFQEENVKYLWWKQSFSSKNILKSLLYATLAVIFLAVAYHYDFIACFGLYLISLIWLFFQGDRQRGKNNRVS